MTRCSGLNKDRYLQTLGYYINEFSKMKSEMLLISDPNTDTMFLIVRSYVYIDLKYEIPLHWFMGKWEIELLLDSISLDILKNLNKITRLYDVDYGD